MPSRKDVSSLSSLCVEVIAQLLVEMIQILHKDKLKEVNNKDQHTTNIEDGQHNSDNASSHEQETVPEKQTEKDSQEKRKDDTLRDNQETKKDDASRDNQVTKKDDALRDNQGKMEDDALRDNKDTKEDNALRNNHETKEDNALGNNHETKEDNALRLDRLNSYRKDLVKLLTSHSHVALHEKMFSSVMSRLNNIYMTNKKTRPVIQDIVPHFINSSLRNLNFAKSRMFAEATMCQVIFDHLQNASRLTKLDIGRPCYWRADVFEKLSSKLKSLPQLIFLSIQYICTPEMISGLAESCPNLSELNLKGSEKITDEECDEIAKCTSLKCLDISATRITGRGCWKIIESIKTLSWLQHCAFNCNSDALLFESRAQLFDCIKEQLNRRDDPVDVVQHSSLKNVFNLKNFWLFNPSSESILSSLLCPHLEQLRLDFIFQDLPEEPDVSVLAQIPKLCKFQANLYDSCFVDLVSQMVENCGNKLTSLDLHLADDYFCAAQVHNVVARCCPSLVSLRFTGDYKGRHTLDECDDCLDFGIETPAHPNLENLSLTGVVSDCRLRFILNHTPAIRTLYLDGELEWLHDDTFKTLLDSNPFSQLESVWLNVSTTVTLDTVRMLLLHDNSIHTIGRLCHMAEANMIEYQELQTLVRQNNLDVKLIWVTDERN